MSDEFGPTSLDDQLHDCPTCGNPCSRFRDGVYRAHIRPAVAGDPVLMTSKGRDYAWCETGVVVVPP